MQPFDRRLIIIFFVIFFFSLSLFFFQLIVFVYFFVQSSNAKAGNVASVTGRTRAELLAMVSALHARLDALEGYQSVTQVSSRPKARNR